MKDKENQEAQMPKFEGQGQTLRGGVKRKGEDEKREEPDVKKEPSAGRRLDGKKI